MARNWGGSGIENFLLSGESLVLRYGNSFLTTRRYAKYRTISSSFEFENLEDIGVEPDRGWPLRMLLASFAMAIVILDYLSLPTEPVTANQIIQIVLGIVVLGQSYYICRIFCTGAFRVVSGHSRRRYVIRTLRTAAGKSFVEQLMKASDAMKPMGGLTGAGLFP